MDTFDDFQAFFSHTVMGDRGNSKTDGENESARLLLSIIDNFDEPRARDQSLASANAVSERNRNRNVQNSSRTTYTPDAGGNQLSFNTARNILDPADSRDDIKNDRTVGRNRRMSVENQGATEANQLFQNRPFAQPILVNHQTHPRPNQEYAQVYQENQRLRAERETHLLQIGKSFVSPSHLLFFPFITFIQLSFR